MLARLPAWSQHWERRVKVSVRLLFIIQALSAGRDSLFSWAPRATPPPVATGQWDPLAGGHSARHAAVANFRHSLGSTHPKHVGRIVQPLCMKRTCSGAAIAGELLLSLLFIFASILRHNAMLYIPEGVKRPHGRPYTRWWQDVIPKDIQHLGFPKPSGEEAFMRAQRRDD